MSGQDYAPLTGAKKIKAGKTTERITAHALPGAKGTIKLKLIPTANFYDAPAPAQAKMRLSDTD